MAQSSGNRSTFVTAQRAVAATLRTTLTTGVASAALFAYSGRPVRAQTVPSGCVSSLSGTVLTCTGDRSSGVLLDTTGSPLAYTTLNVGNLATNITPPSGDSGVAFISDGNVAVNVATGPFSIVTTGDDAVGILGSSIAGDVAILSSPDISTSGDNADGIAARAEFAASVAAAGTITTGGSTANGIFATSANGPVNIASTARIITDGYRSAGIRATAGADPINIFSGGAITTYGSQAAAIFATSSSGRIDIASFGDIDTRENLAFGIYAASAGAVDVAVAGNIITRGEDAPALVITSMGGTVDIVSTADITTFEEGSPAIAARAAGNVTIASSGDIHTFGEDANGIFAVSIGGNVDIESRGDILTEGSTSSGIYASASGQVTVRNFGAINAGNYGIYAYGQAGNLVVNYGTIEGCDCAGVLLISNGTNTLENRGSIIAVAGGNAIESDGADNQVENRGVVTGNVLFFDGVNPGTGTFTNHNGALFNTGDLVLAGLVTNNGTIAPGGRGIIQMTSLSDDLGQGASGVFAVDLDPNALSDRNDYLIVSDTATLAGNVAVSMLSLPAVATDTFTILSAMGLPGSLINNGLGLIASPALHATLTFNGNDLELAFAIGFNADGLNPNQRAIAIGLHQIYDSGIGTLGPALLGLLNVGDLAGYKAALNQLSPEIYSNAEIAALYSSLAFSNSLLSCKVNGAGTAAIIHEGQCLWAGANASFLDSSTTTDQIGFTQVAGLFNAGAQVALDDVWRMGFGAGYQSSTLQTATNAQSEGSLAQAGLSVKYNPGPLLLAGAVTGGGAWYDTTRPMAFGGFAGVAEGEQDIGIVSGSLRAAYVLGSPHLYYKPILDLALTHLELGGFTESGGGGAALSVAGGGQTVFSLAPTLEVGSEWWMSNGTLVRPLIRAGAIWYDGADFALTAAFAGAPAGVSPFTINTDIDEVMGLVGAGVEVINGKDSVLRLSYDGQLGADTQIHSVGVKGSAKF
ncbi:MAG: autotransporter domain-containing protein [Hyphomicrobium sp.]|nr:autotransporter domain-containing protein [Hyphomicrobium sp.]